MDKFYIITNRDKDQNLRFTEEIVQYLKEHGKKCQVQQAERRVEGEYHSQRNPAAGNQSRYTWFSCGDR